MHQNSGWCELPEWVDVVIDGIVCVLCYAIDCRLLFCSRCFFFSCFSFVRSFADMQMFTYIRQNHNGTHAFSVYSHLCCLIWQSMQQCVRFVVKWTQTHAHRSIVICFFFFWFRLSKRKTGTGTKTATKTHSTCSREQTSVSFSFLSLCSSSQNHCTHSYERRSFFAPFLPSFHSIFMCLCLRFVTRFRTLSHSLFRWSFHCSSDSEDCVAYVHVMFCGFFCCTHHLRCVHVRVCARANSIFLCSILCCGDASFGLFRLCSTCALRLPAALRHIRFHCRWYSICTRSISTTHFHLPSTDRSVSVRIYDFFGLNSHPFLWPQNIAFHTQSTQRQRYIRAMMIVFNRS